LKVKGPVAARPDRSFERGRSQRDLAAAPLPIVPRRTGPRLATWAGARHGRCWCSALPCRGTECRRTPADRPDASGLPCRLFSSTWRRTTPGGAPHRCQFLTIGLPEPTWGGRRQHAHERGAKRALRPGAEHPRLPQASESRQDRLLCQPASVLARSSRERRAGDGGVRGRRRDGRRRASAH